MKSAVATLCCGTASKTRRGKRPWGSGRLATHTRDALIPRLACVAKSLAARGGPLFSPSQTKPCPQNPLKCVAIPRRECWRAPILQQGTSKRRMPHASCLMPHASCRTPHHALSLCPPGTPVPPGTQPSPPRHRGKAVRHPRTYMQPLLVVRQFGDTPRLRRAAAWVAVASS